MKKKILFGAALLFAAVPVDAGVSGFGPVSNGFSPLLAEDETSGLYYTCTPANGTMQPLPDDHAVTVRFEFPNADSVSIDPYDFPSNPGGGNYSVGMRVTYNDKSVPKVDNALQDYGYEIVDEYGDPLYTIRFNKDVFKTNGKLVIDMDEGFFQVDGQPSPAIEYSLEFGDNKVYQYNVSPEPGEYYEIAEFQVSFPDAQTAEFVDGSYVVLSGPSSRQMYVVTKVDDTEVPTFNIVFDPAPWKDGGYALMVEEGAFILDGSYISPAIYAGGYTLLRSTPIDMSCKPSPEKGRVIAESYGTYVNFVFSEDETCIPVEGYEDMIKAYFDGVELVQGNDYIARFSAVDGAKILIEIEGDSPYLGRTGSLRVTVDEGAVLIAGQKMAAVDFTWEVVSPMEYTLSLIPEAGSAVASLADIKVTIPQADTAELFSMNNISLRANDYSYFDNPKSATLLEGTEHPVFELVFDPAPQNDGKYVLSFSYGAFFFDDVKDSEIYDFTYVLNSALSGVDGINDSSDQRFNVFSIDGRLLLENAVSTDGLDKGIYIVNGRKVAVK